MVNKQKFKGKILFRKSVVNNILTVYNDTRFDADGDWYNVANLLAQNLAQEFKLNVLQVAGVIAALSPLKSWNENKRIARQFLKNGNGYHTRAMKSKAHEIISYNGDYQREFILTSLNGNKISNFFLNIAHPSETHAVTIDRHAISICLGRSIKDNEGKDITNKQYEFLASCYRQASELVGIIPNQMQSITWEKWRANKTKNKFSKVPF